MVLKKATIFSIITVWKSTGDIEIKNMIFYYFTYKYKCTSQTCKDVIPIRTLRCRDCAFDVLIALKLRGLLLGAY